MTDSSPQAKGGRARAAALSPDERSAIASTAATARWHGKPTVTSLRVVIRQIEKHKAAISKHRDALREIYNDLEAVVESADDAVESLGYAVERLSEHL